MADPPDPAAPLVVVAENEPAVARLLAVSLERHGCAVEIVADGEAALARVAQGGVRVLVCDLEMPRIGGEQVVAALAGDPAAPRVVIASAFVDDALEKRLRASDVVAGVWRKPFELGAFGEAIARLCKP